MSSYTTTADRAAGRAPRGVTRWTYRGRHRAPVWGDRLAIVSSLMLVALVVAMAAAGVPLSALV